MFNGTIYFDKLIQSKNKSFLHSSCFNNIFVIIDLRGGFAIWFSKHFLPFQTCFGFFQELYLITKTIKITKIITTINKKRSNTDCDKLPQ